MVTTTNSRKNRKGYWCIYISYPTIYRYIREGLVKYVKKDLRQGGKKFNKSTEKRGKIKVGDRAIMYRPTFRK